MHPRLTDGKKLEGVDMSKARSLLEACGDEVTFEMPKPDKEWVDIDQVNKKKNTGPIEKTAQKLNRLGMQLQPDGKEFVDHHQIGEYQVFAYLCEKIEISLYKGNSMLASAAFEIEDDLAKIAEMFSSYKKAIPKFEEAYGHIMR